jgi:hypothetical protein
MQHATSERNCCKWTKINSLLYVGKKEEKVVEDEDREKNFYHDLFFI